MEIIVLLFLAALLLGLSASVFWLPHNLLTVVQGKSDLGQLGWNLVAVAFAFGAAWLLGWIDTNWFWWAIGTLTLAGFITSLAKSSD